MGKKNRVTKTLIGKLSDLDDHLFLLRDALYRVGQDETHLKSLSTELRNLICKSSRTEGLLWRLVDDLQVSDAVHVQLAGGVDPNHPLAKGMMFAIVPVHRAGFGPDDPKLAARHYSLRQIIKEHSALFVSGRNITHEWLIKTISQQIGSAHEDDAVERRVVELGQYVLNGQRSYVPVLVMDAELTLEVGERVLEKAEKDKSFSRKRRKGDYGNVSIILRTGYHQELTDAISFTKLRSYVSDVEIECLARPSDFLFRVKKHGRSVVDIPARHPDGWTTGQDAVVCLSYCSDIGEAHASVNGASTDDGIKCPAGWLHANEFKFVDVPKGHENYIYRQFITIHGNIPEPNQLSSLLDMTQEEFMAGYQQWMNG